MGGMICSYDAPSKTIRERARLISFRFGLGKSKGDYQMSVAKISNIPAQELIAHYVFRFELMKLKRSLD